MVFESGKALKVWEEDDYEQGCLPETGGCFDVDITFSANTVEELLKKMCDWYGVERGNLELNACDQLGRVDIDILEDENSFKPSESQIEAWKKGQKKLYASTYTYHIMEVTRKVVDLQGY